MADASKHPPKSELVKVRMTVAERRMLRTLAVRSGIGSDSGFIRRLIRDAWTAREIRRVGDAAGADS